MSLEDVTFLSPYLASAFAVLDGLVLLEECLVRLETQSLGGDSKYIVLLKGIDGDIGRKTWFQLQVYVGGRDDNLVGDDVTLCGSLLSDLCHSTLERVIGEGVDRKGDTLTFFYATDIGFVDISDDTHVRQVLSDSKQLWGIEGSCYSLTFFH